VTVLLAAGRVSLFRQVLLFFIFVSVRYVLVLFLFFCVRSCFGGICCFVLVASVFLLFVGFFWRSVLVVSVLLFSGFARVSCSFMLLDYVLCFGLWWYPAVYSMLQRI
jgi:hypothetical protein